MPPPPEFSCAVSADVATYWQDGSNYATTVNLNVRALSQNVAVPWELTVVNSAYTGVSSSWNWGARLSGTGTVVGSAIAQWQSLTAGGTAVGVGMVVMGSNQNLAPTAVKLNGASCTLSVNGSPPSG